MDDNDKTFLVDAVELQPYTEQPAHAAQPGYQPQPGYPPPQRPGYALQSMQQVQQSTTVANAGVYRSHVEGDYEEALKTSKQTKWMNVVAIIIGVVIIVGGFIFYYFDSYRGPY
ncbi:hypothetical protein OS493_034574 [Desmophyllum pertusum]|uniref:Uncharacterized protein n=1 Tax=Desmophyllum pertusum TaxID=174260 RepID=A0A9X0CCV9_9CNID|nr:hypothetical protein OS493_034574 [Desmophyllum pertusum]